MRLHDGIAALGLALPATVEEKMVAYLALLTKWNRVYNLTAIRDPEQMVTHHLLDSLAVLPHLGDIQTMVDVGSGGGLPGLVLAICQPNLQITSVETSQKKAAFQQQVKIELGLTNVSIHCGRIELMTGIFDVAISRAFADLSDFIRLTGHLTRRLLAMKGVYPQAEIDHLPADWRLANSIELTVPGLDAERHLIVLEKT